MKREDDLELWDLLGAVSTPALSPFLARNVIRQIRAEKSWFEHVRSWLGSRTLIPASAVALAILVSTLSTRLPGRISAADKLPEAIASIDPQDYEAVADLDDLLAADDDGLWNENESSRL